MKHIWHLRPHKTGYLLDIGRTQFPCLVGKSGLVAVDEKRGDGATPKGCWPVRCLYYRPDRIARYQLPDRLPLSMRALVCKMAGAMMPARGYIIILSACLFLAAMKSCGARMVYITLLCRLAIMMPRL